MTAPSVETCGKRGCPRMLKWGISQQVFIEPPPVPGSSGGSRAPLQCIGAGVLAGGDRQSQRCGEMTHSISDRSEVSGRCAEKTMQYSCCAKCKTQDANPSCEPLEERQLHQLQINGPGDVPS